MNEYRLSIDYGTTNTVAYLQPPDDDAAPVLFDGQPVLPSAVWASPDRSLLTGHEAVNSAALDPGRYEPNPKRRIADRTVLLGDDEFPVAQLIGATLARVYAEALRRAGDDHLRVILTYPAAWGADLVRLLRNAAGHAGIDRPDLVTEPEAAAAFLIATGGAVDGAPLVVYDLGAGTCDITAVLRSGRTFDRLATNGLNNVGGLDLDEVVLKLLGRTLAGTHPDEWARLTSPVGPDRQHARRLWDDCRIAKERLTTDRTAQVLVPLVGEDVRVGRADFERDARSLLEPTVTVTESVLRKARVGRDDRAELVLVGGATRTPLVSTLLTQSTGRVPRHVANPELVVAQGALDHLRMVNNEQPRRRPWSDVTVPRPARVGDTLHEPMTGPTRPAAGSTRPIRGEAPTRPAEAVAGPTRPVRDPGAAVPGPFRPAPVGQVPPAGRRPAGPHKKLIPNPQLHLKSTVRAGLVLLAGIVLWAWSPATLFAVAGVVLTLVGMAGVGIKLVDWVLCIRYTRPLVVDQVGITVTFDGADTTFGWADIATVYLHRHRLSRWLVCTPAANSPLGSDSRTARFWSKPYGLFFLTSASGFGDQLVRDALEAYAGDRYRG